MTDVAMPKSFLSFADALRMLAQSSLDATEIVTKWDEITDVSTPRIVKITINGVTHEVPNIAKIRKDITEGLNSDYPEVQGLKIVTLQAHGSVDVGGYDGIVWHNDGGNPYRSGTGFIGVLAGLYNDFRSMCMPTTAEVRTQFLNLPKVMALGAATAPGITPQSVLNLYVTAPPRSLVSAKRITSDSYYTTVTFINRNFGRQLPDGTPEHGEGLPFTLNIYNVTGGLLYTKVLQPHRSVQLFMFAAPEQSTINVQEIIYGD